MPVTWHRRAGSVSRGKLTTWTTDMQAASASRTTEAIASIHPIKTVSHALLILRQHWLMPAFAVCPQRHPVPRNDYGISCRLLKAIDVQDYMATLQRGRMQTVHAQHATLRAVRDARVVCRSPTQELDPPRRTGARDRGRPAWTRRTPFTAVERTPCQKNAIVARKTRRSRP